MDVTLTSESCNNTVMTAVYYCMSSGAWAREAPCWCDDVWCQVFVGLDPWHWSDNKSTSTTWLWVTGWCCADWGRAARGPHTVPTSSLSLFQCEFFYCLISIKIWILWETDPGVYIRMSFYRNPILHMHNRWSHFSLSYAVFHKVHIK